MESQTKHRVSEETISRVQLSTKELQDYYSDLVLSMQTLQASSYRNVYVWKIPDFQRRRRDSVLGKTISLYTLHRFTPLVTGTSSACVCTSMVMEQVTDLTSPFSYV